MKKRSQINETSESLTFKNSVEFDFVRLASCSPDEPKGEKKTNLSFSLCSHQMWKLQAFFLFSKKNWAKADPAKGPDFMLLEHVS